jgi:ferredoxin
VVRVLKGAEHCRRAGSVEKALARREGFAADERAACCLRLKGTGAVTLTTTYW